MIAAQTDPQPKPSTSTQVRKLRPGHVRRAEDWVAGQVHRRGASRWCGGGPTEQGSQPGLLRQQQPARCREGDSVVIVGRNAHKSVVQAFN